MKKLHTCGLCEALCGIELEVEGDQIQSVRGDPLDPLSAGHICPKATALIDLYRDPDRIQTPLLRSGDGFRAIGWDEALDYAAERLVAIERAHGRHALGVYLGNPNVHHYGTLLMNLIFSQVVRTKNRYSATSADQLPHMFAALAMFGHQLMLPVPDLDRTDLWIVLGANPLASNGSIMTAPDVRGRIRRLKARGGALVVLDPRRTETAEHADSFYFVRPGTDALLLFALLEAIDRDGRIVTPDYSKGLEPLLEAARAFPAERVAETVGLPAEAIRALADRFARTERAVLYGRFGVCTQPYAGLSAWLIYALNAVTGHLDRPGGLMFARPAVDLLSLTGRLGQRGHHGRYTTRARKLPEFSGELPVSALIEEIEQPGERQIRALITVAGNPVLSTPDGARLDRALAQLDFVLSLDLYVNETSRHAHLILPAPSPLERDHYGLVFHALAVRNTARYSPAPLPLRGDTREDAQTLLDLAERILKRRGGTRNRARALAIRAAARLGPRQLIDLGLRSGPYGAGLGKRGLSLATLQRHPHGVDLGALTPCLPERLHTADGKLDLAPEVFLRDVPRLLAALEGGVLRPRSGLQLIGRRHLRSNNSWLHNSARLLRGPERCTLLMHPLDAAARGIDPQGEVRIRSAVGEIQVPVAIDSAIMPGVVSLPHGFGHGRPGVLLSVAGTRPGQSLNDLTDPKNVDPLTGNAAFSALEVEVCAVQTLEGTRSGVGAVRSPP